MDRSNTSVGTVIQVFNLFEDLSDLKYNSFPGLFSFFVVPIILSDLMIDFMTMIMVDIMVDIMITTAAPPPPGNNNNNNNNNNNGPRGFSQSGVIADAVKSVAGKLSPKNHGSP